MEPIDGFLEVSGARGFGFFLEAVLEVGEEFGDSFGHGEAEGGILDAGAFVGEVAAKKWKRGGRGESVEGTAEVMARGDGGVG